MVIICPKFWFLCAVFIHLKTLKYSFYFPYGFCFFFTTWLQLKFTKPTFSLPPHQVLRDKKQCMTRLEWLHPAKANTQSYGNDWGVVFNKGASQRNPYKPEKLHHWHCVYTSDIPSYKVCFKRHSFSWIAFQQQMAENIMWFLMRPHPVIARNWRLQSSFIDLHNWQ